LSIGGVYGHTTFTPEFKEEAVRQITERGYSIAEVSERLGVSAHSLYKWLRAVKPDNSDSRHRIYWMPEQKFSG
jgi:transposase